MSPALRSRTDFLKTRQFVSFKRQSYGLLGPTAAGTFSCANGKCHAHVSAQLRSEQPNYLPGTCKISNARVHSEAELYPAPRPLKEKHSVGQVPSMIVRAVPSIRDPRYMGHTPQHSFVHIQYTLIKIPDILSLSRTLGVYCTAGTQTFLLWVGR